MNPKVSIIILNWNSWKETIECLESVYQINYPNYDVIVVDNGSEDNSIQKIKEYCTGKIKVRSNFLKYNIDNKPIMVLEYPRKEIESKTNSGKKIIANLPPNRKLIIIKNEENYGFTEGNNVGIRFALNALNPDYILLLNNDTVVDKEFLSELVKVAESDEKIGLVGPKIYYYDEPKKINFIGGLINYWLGNWHIIGQNEIDYGQYENVVEVDWVNGCCFIIRNETLKCTGLLDSRFPMGYEDVDISLRALKCNFRIFATGKSKIWHKIGASRKKSKKLKKLRHYIKYFYYTFGTKLLLIGKHWRGVKLVTALIFNIIYIPYWTFRYILLHLVSQ